MNDIEIKPGPELDRAVAESIGLDIVMERGVVVLTRRQWDELQGIEHNTTEGGIAQIPFKPSTDLNAALEAAESVGLFKQYKYCQAAGLHVISKSVPVASWADSIAEAETQELAICAAILNLKESS